MKRLTAEKKALQAQSDEFDKKYVSVDVKGVSTNPYSDKLKLNDLQTTELKNMLRSEFKGMNVDIRLVVIGSVNNTSSQRNASVLILDPAYSAEFASCAALFEEVRVKRVKITYFPISSRTFPVAGSNTTTAGLGLGFMSIDCITATAISAPSDGVDSSNHSIYRLSAQLTSVGGAGVTCEHLNTNGKIDYKPPPLLLPNAATSVGLVGGSWTSTAGSAGAVCTTGYLKFYEDNDSTTTTAQVGQVYEQYHCEFRMRD